MLLEPFLKEAHVTHLQRGGITQTLILKFMTWTLGLFVEKYDNQIMISNVQMFQIYFCLFAGECPKLINNGGVEVIFDLI